MEENGESKLLAYYETSDGRKSYDLVHIDNRYYCVISGVGVLCIFLPDGINGVYCTHNFLTELILPESADNIYCDHNNIKNLNLPPKVKTLFCDLMDGIEEQYKKGMSMTFVQKR